MKLSYFLDFARIKCLKRKKEKSFAKIKFPKLLEKTKYSFLRFLFLFELWSKSFSWAQFLFCLSAIQKGEFTNRNFENFKALLDRGAVLNEITTSTHYHRSHLVRGGLESSSEVTIKLAKGFT